ncbi:hypothetical protein BH09ACT1_BH09ACT1_16330 [soil metagenome]
MSSELPPAPAAVRSRARNAHGTPPVRHGRLKHSHPVATVAKFLGAFVAVVAVSAASVAGYAVYDVASSIKPGITLEALPGKTVEAIPDLGAIDGGANILLAGTDTRTDQAGFTDKANQNASSGAGNNDVTMLLHISADHTHAAIVSFPRDLIVPVPKCGNVGASSAVMFNTTLSRGGLSCTVLTVENMTGLDIQYAGEISFDGVIAMSNAVGGVTVCLATAVKDPYVGLNLAAGNQTLEGGTALAFLRSRHGVGDGSDLGRISNQQVFLSALLRTITSAKVLSNPITVYSLAKAAVNNIQLTTGLTSPTQIASVALALKTVPLSSIVFVQYPSAADPANANRVVPISSAASILNAALRADQPLTLTGTVGRAAEADPSATTAAPNPSGSAAPETSASPAASGVALPSSITGQTASQQTCTKGNN